jgi:hypothetical protein
MRTILFGILIVSMSGCLVSTGSRPPGGPPPPPNTAREQRCQGRAAMVERDSARRLGANTETRRINSSKGWLVAASDGNNTIMYQETEPGCGDMIGLLKGGDPEALPNQQDWWPNISTREPTSGGYIEHEWRYEGAKGTGKYQEARARECKPDCQAWQKR